MQMLFQGDLGKQTPEQVGKTFWQAREEFDADDARFCRGYLSRGHSARRRD